MLRNLYNITQLTLDMLLHYLAKLKIQIFCRYGRKLKQIAFLIAANFIIHPQILIFLVLKIASLPSLRTKAVLGRFTWQNDRVYAPHDTRKRSIAAERLLRCRPTFRKSRMVSVAVSKLGCSLLFFVEPGVKVDGRCYRDVIGLLELLVTRRCSSRIAPHLTMLATLSSYCGRRLQGSLHPTCGYQTAQT